MELPTDDLELVHALQIAPRASWKQLAPILDRHPTTLATRWARLREAGLAWVTAYQSSAGMEGCAAFIGVECLPGHRAGVLERMCGLSAVVTVEESARDWDLRLTALAPSWQVLSATVLAKVREDPGVARVRVTVVTRLFVTGNSWRLDALSTQQRRALSALHPAPRQHLGASPPDLEIMTAALQRDGRATHAQLAAATGTHPTTAARHLNQAVSAGTITVRCELAQEYSGYPVSCQWYVRVSPGHMQAAVDHLRGYRTLRLCAATTGDTNLTFLLWLRFPEAILDVESGLQAAAPSLQVVESDVGVRTHKRMGWLLNEDSTATGTVI